MTPRAWRVLAAPLASATVTAIARNVLDSRTGPGWRRRNYRGSSVTLSAGPAAALGLLAGTALAGSPSAAIAVAGAAGAGFYDDWASADEDERRVKGFAGHWGALTSGRASAGAVKVAAIGSASLAAAIVRRGVGVDTAIDGCLAAGVANLCNLLDLRPGRALKVAALVAGLTVPGSREPERALLGAACATIAVSLPADLGERSMLGDTGANAVGALIGSTLCARSRAGRLCALAVVAALTALSERVSFSAVIVGNPVLRRLDELGRTVD